MQKTIDPNTETLATIRHPEPAVVKTKVALKENLFKEKENAKKIVPKESD